MLVLCRREGVGINLATSEGLVTVRLNEYNGQQTRFGIGTPTSVRALREELREAGEPRIQTASP